MYIFLSIKCRFNCGWSASFVIVPFNRSLPVVSKDNWKKPFLGLFSEETSIGLKALQLSPNSTAPGDSVTYSGKFLPKWSRSTICPYVNSVFKRQTNIERVHHSRQASGSRHSFINQTNSFFPSKSDVLRKPFLCWYSWCIEWSHSCSWAPLCSPHVREFGLRNLRIRSFCLWNPKSGNFAGGIRNPTNDWNPESKFHWQRSQKPVSEIRNLSRGIHNLMRPFGFLHWANIIICIWVKVTVILLCIPKVVCFTFCLPRYFFLIGAPCGCLQKEKKKNPGHIDLSYTPNSPYQSIWMNWLLSSKTWTFSLFSSEVLRPGSDAVLFMSRT